MINCSKLHEIIRRGLRFRYDSNFADTLKKIPKNYIIFEKDESAHDGERIVYIGINAAQDRLSIRINKHFNGNMRNSRLRKHIGSCLIQKGISTDLEKEISEYIQTHMSFVIIAVQDENERKDLEKKLIGTVADCKECKATENWLGKNCSAPKISNGKLWNVQHLESQSLSDKDIQLIHDGLVLKCDVSKEFKEFSKD